MAGRSDAHADSSAKSNVGARMTTTDTFKDIERLESDLWEAADNLRANSKLTSSDYFMPVLGVSPRNQHQGASVPFSCVQPPAARRREGHGGIISIPDAVRVRVRSREIGREQREARDRLY